MADLVNLFKVTLTMVERQDVSTGFNIDTPQKVVVTSATGFVAGLIEKRLVEAGVYVHATVGDPDDQKKISHSLAPSEKGPEKVILLKSDLLAEVSFNEAIKVCTIVFHTVSPFIIKFKVSNKSSLN